MDYDEETMSLLEAARGVCLTFPEAAEIETWGHPTFRVRNKIFASFGISDADDTASITMKAPSGEQTILLATGAPFFYPKYVGTSGWIGVSVGCDTDWTEIAELVDDSYRMTAPKKLIAELD